MQNLKEVCKSHRDNGAVTFYSDGAEVYMRPLNGVLVPVKGNEMAVMAMVMNAKSPEEDLGLSCVLEVALEC